MSFAFIARALRASLKWMGLQGQASGTERQEPEAERRSQIPDPQDAEFFHRRKDDSVGGEG
jgi:hypothetical protein